MRRFLFLVFAGFFILPASSFAGPLEEGWTQAKQGKGITVYTRPVQGSKFVAFMGVTDVEAPMEVVEQVFRDYKSFPEWYAMCNEIRLLKDFTRDHKIIYFIADMPMPVQDRDMVVDTVFEVNKEPGKTFILMNALKDPIVPVQSKYVRMTHLVGRYTLTKINDNTTHVVYKVDSDPAGYIPAWITNAMAEDQPYLTLKGLKEMVEKDVYYEKAGMKKKG